MNENDFNALLGKELRKRHNSLRLHHVKLSDKFSIGLSDFLIWWRGKNCALEVKAFREPASKNKLLSHPFKGDQTTFMESLQLTGTRCFGLVYEVPTKLMYLVESNQIPENGNFSSTNHLYSLSRTAVCFPEQVDTILEVMFS